MVNDTKTSISLIELYKSTKDIYMFKKVKLVAISAVVSAISSGAMAHSGHDHSDASSGLIHLAWLAPVLIAGAFVSYRVRKNKLANEEK